MRDSTSKDDAQCQITDAIVSDMADLGLQIGSESDPSLLLATVDRLWVDHDFPRVRNLAKQLVAQAVQDAAIRMSGMPYSGSIDRDDLGQADCWEEYKCRIQKGYDFPHYEMYRDVMKVCCSDVADSLKIAQQRLIQTCMLKENSGEVGEPQTIAELVLGDLAPFLENLDPVLEDKS